MDPADKDLLILRRVELVENIDIGNGLLTHLLSRKVLNQRMVQSITYNKPPDRQVEELLDLLPKRGGSAFKLFCESLIATDQEDVVTNILKKSVDTATSAGSAATAATTSSVTAVSVPPSPIPSTAAPLVLEEPILDSVPFSQPSLDDASLDQLAPLSGEPSLFTQSLLDVSPPLTPHKRKTIQQSREASENEDRSVIASPSETDSSPQKRIRPEPVIRICGDNENDIKIYNPFPDEKGDHAEKSVYKHEKGDRAEGSMCTPAPLQLSLPVHSLVSCPRGARAEDVRYILKHFLMKDAGEGSGEEEHIRLASSMLADLPQELLKLMSRKGGSSAKKMHVEDCSEIMRERLSRCDSIDTMETRKPQNLRLDVGRQPEGEQVVVVAGTSSGMPPVPVMRSGDGPVHVHVEECTRHFYNINKDKAYRMVAMPRGQALIINVNEVLEKPPRRGTDIDRDNLKNLLEQLHFQVTLYNDEDDLTALGMAEKLRAFARKPEHQSADACVICLLSHGEEGYMFGTDGKKIPLDEVFLLFDNRHCPSLLNKPKIFFIQACRGGMLDQGVKVRLDEPDGGPPDNNIQQHPSMSDMLICYPTLQGYYAWRNREKGSWYIEAVVKVFMKYAKCEDVCAMLNRVNSDVSRKVSRTPQTEMDRMSQMSEYKSSLRKPYLFFFPGIGAPAPQ